jgi:hypothetical protein
MKYTDNTAVANKCNSAIIQVSKYHAKVIPKFTEPCISKVGEALAEVNEIWPDHILHLFNEEMITAP